MSAFWGKADMAQTNRNVRFLPKADVVTLGRLVDHLVVCVVKYDGRLEILKLWLASASRLACRPADQV